MEVDPVIGLLGVAIAVVASVYSGKIDRPGGITGGLITCILFWGGGWLGVSLIGVFFVLGTLASRWKQRQKTVWGVAEERSGQRGWRNVVANAGVAGGIALAIVINPSFASTGRLLMAACFAAALSDTWSSEFGNVYGSRYYHVLSGKKDQRGRDGVVSVEGSLAGLLGSGVIACLFGLWEGVGFRIGVVLLAGLFGNLVDSLLGATLERKGVIGNHTVNFSNTLMAALLAYFLVKSGSINS